MIEYIVISRDELSRIITEAYAAGFAQLHHPDVSYSLPTGWRPIAEAPKDGTWVLVAGPSSSVSMPWTIEAARWSLGNWININGNAFYGGPNSYEPTQFLPLVEPEK